MISTSISSAVSTQSAVSKIILGFLIKDLKGVFATVIEISTLPSSKNTLRNFGSSFFAAAKLKVLPPIVIVPVLSHAPLTP